MEESNSRRDLAPFRENPGAVKYGNFINYYSFHDTKQRIKNLNAEVFPKNFDNDIVCIDIGCNTGKLTEELYSYLKAVYPTNNIHILAVDIDPVLIERALESCNSSEITFKTLDIMLKRDREEIKKYLTAHGKDAFDITFCFSVTMWIHLNNGDKGIQDFLKYIRDTSNFILIEPQPWHCYRNAQRRMKRAGSNFELYDSLKIRNDVEIKIDRILKEKSHQKVYVSDPSSWHRKIQCYQLQK